VRIEILYFEGCPHHEAAEELVRDALSELGMEAELVRIAVTDERAAVKARFRGSPTIRINGNDIEPDVDTGPYGLRCRVYSGPFGLSGIPARDVVLAKLAAGGP
jgi:glutaredoxin